MVPDVANGNGEDLNRLPGGRWVDVETMYDLGAYKAAPADRIKMVEAVSKNLKESKPGELGDVKPMGLVQEVLACLFLFFVVGAMLWLPLSIALLVIFVRSLKFWAIFLVVMTILAHHPISFWPAFLHCR